MECSRRGAIVWRNNTGVLPDKRGIPVRFGLCKGSADLIGIYLGKFLAIEVKTSKEKLKPEQVDYLNVVRNNGGIAGVARCINDVKIILNNGLTY